MDMMLDVLNKNSTIAKGWFSLKRNDDDETQFE